MSRNERGLSRREFVRGVALGSAAVAVWPGSLEAGLPLRPEDHLRSLAWQGLSARLGAQVPIAYRSRLTDELDVLTRLGFTREVLRLHEVVSWARDQGIPMIPGYGVGSASLAFWALGLGTLDPVAHGLCFERFINWRRPQQAFPFYSFPVCARRQPEILEHLARLHGVDHVAYVNWREDVRVEALYMSWHSELSPETEEAFLDALRREPEAMAAAVSDPAARMPLGLEGAPGVRRLIETARELLRDPAACCNPDGVPGGAMLVSDAPLREVRARRIEGRQQPVATQDTWAAEKAGMRLVRCPPFRALTALDAASVQPWPPDRRVFDMIAAGDVDGVVGFESHIRPFLRRVRPASVVDVAAAFATFRPGCIEAGLTDDFVEGQRGWSPRRDACSPTLDRILAPTRGVFIYQEQLMLVAQQIAGLDLAEADLMRRGLGKRREDELARWHHRFLEGAAQRGIDRAAADWTFARLEQVAGLLFSRAYALSAATLSLRLACLKAHAPAEFARVTVAARMTSDPPGTLNL